MIDILQVKGGQELLESIEQLQELGDQVSSAVATKADASSLDNYALKSEIPGAATDSIGGIVKLYTSTGNNTDGTISQSAITSALGAKADAADIPDVSSFITNTVNNLTNYYTKSEVYTQSEINTMISNIPKMSIEVVNDLPTTDIDSETIYLVRNTSSSGTNLFTEYIYVNNTWEELGAQQLDLSGYATTAALNTALADYTTTTNLNTLLAAKADSTDIPTATSDLTNDSGFITASDISVTTQVAQAQLTAVDNTVVQVGETYLRVSVNGINYIVHIPQARVASDIAMTGFTTGTSTNAVAASDNVSSAIAKLQNRIAALEAQMDNAVFLDS